LKNQNLQYEVDTFFLSVDEKLTDSGTDIETLRSFSVEIAQFMQYICISSSSNSNENEKPYCGIPPVDGSFE
jgi:hypothetical protein